MNGDLKLGKLFICLATLHEYPAHEGSYEYRIRTVSDEFYWSLNRFKGRQISQLSRDQYL